MSRQRELACNDNLTYTRFLGQRLRDRCKDLSAKRVSLLDELAMMRAMAVDAVEAYEMSMDAIENVTPPVNAMKRSTVAMAASRLVMEAMNQVRDMAVAAHRCMQVDAMDPISMQALIYQVAKTIDSQLEGYAPQLIAAGLDPRQLMDDVALALEDITMPEVPEQAMLLPDADAEARAMDDTIPEQQQDVA